MNALRKARPLRALGLLSLLSAACGGRGEALHAYEGAPVILISVDTLRADHLPAYGYKGVATPHLDALAADSILWENAYSHVPLTLPSHLSILTGLLPAEHQVRDNIGYRFDGEKHKTLARVLKAHGYATGGAVSAYVLRGGTGIRDSMDFFDDAIGAPSGAVQDLSSAQRPGSETVARALAWVDTVKGRPFFLFLHLYEPHRPYEPQEPFKTRYGATYDAEIATTDAILGDFLETLKRQALYDPSLIVFLSDHGEGLGDHGEQEHGILLYREVLHVPLLVKLPRSEEAGRRIAAPAGLMAVAPTIASLVKVEAPNPAGETLLGGGPSPPGARGVYSETYYPKIHFGWSALRSLVDGRFHYIDGPKPELYDIAADAGERADARDKETAVVHRMRAELGHVEARFSAPGPTDNETAERLRALGYLSGTAPDRSSEAPVNPRDEIQVNEDLKAAFQLVRDGHDPEALDALGKVLARDPGCFDAQRQLAGTLARLGRLDEASAAYKQAIRISPSMAVDVALSLGQVELDLGHLDIAAANAKLALKDEPGHAHELLGAVALARGDVTTAQSEARSALAEGPDAIAAMLLARVYVKRSDLTTALKVLDEAAASAGPRRAVGFDYLRGDVLARLGRYSDAEASFRTEIRAFPRDTNAYTSLAVVLATTGRPNEVRDLLEAMVRANPSRAAALQAAKALDFLGDREGANAWRGWTPKPSVPQ
jgi:arylsulfatase A-like enzyme/Tfp pilus assembly protein PilF